MHALKRRWKGSASKGSQQTSELPRGQGIESVRHVSDGVWVWVPGSLATSNSRLVRRSPIRGMGMGIRNTRSFQLPNSQKKPGFRSTYPAQRNCTATIAVARPYAARMPGPKRGGGDQVTSQARVQVNGGCKWNSSHTEIPRERKKPAPEANGSRH